MIVLFWFLEKVLTQLWTTQRGLSRFFTFLLDCLWDDFDVLRPLTPWIHLKFFYKHFFISIKAQIFSIYLIIYHLFKHFAQAQPKSVMLIKKTQVYLLLSLWITILASWKVFRFNKNTRNTDTNGDVGNICLP